MEKSSIENPVVAENKGKAPKVVKAKIKKKQKTKTTSFNKPKDNPLPAKAAEDINTTPAAPENTTIVNLITNKVKSYALQNDLSTEYCFLVDMSLPSGRNRFFIYDLKKNSVVYAGLVS